MFSSLRCVVDQGQSEVGRYYDPGTDQFLSVDPDLAETGQPYAFTGDDPLNATDPLGLWKRDVVDQLEPTRYTGSQAQGAQLLWLQTVGASNIQVQPRFLGGDRIPDFVYSVPALRLTVLDEVKAGTGGKLNSRTRRQIANDVKIRQSGSVNDVIWDFYEGTTGYQGPSHGLEKALNENHINMRIHVAAPPRDKPKSSGLPVILS